MEINELIALAKSAYDNAYAPYSQFPVGAAVVSEDGQTFNGCNVENVAFPEGVCAEASAISAMVTSGVKQIAEICVYTEADTPIFPCGGCRQKILEFSNANTRVHITSDKGLIQTVTVAELVPFSFSTDNLAPKA